MPVVYGNDNTPRAVAQVCSNDILRVNIAEDPSTAVEPEADGPAVDRRGGLTERSECAEENVGPLGLLTGDVKVLGAGDGEHGSGAGDEGAAGAGGGDGLVVDDLLVDEVCVVKVAVAVVEAVSDALVEGVGG